eukprot:ANDGO_02780.mRNA.1 hypothetical protein
MPRRAPVAEDDDVELQQKRPPRAHIASPAKLRASRVAFLILTIGIVVFGYGYFENFWIKGEASISNTDTTVYYGLFRQQTEMVNGDTTIITITPLSKVSGVPDFSTYEDTAKSCVGLAGTTIAFALLAWIVGLLVIFSLGSHYVDLSCLLLTFLAVFFGIITIAVFESKRPKSGADGSTYKPAWDDFKIWTSEGMAIAGILLFFFADILLFLGKR